MLVLVLAGTGVWAVAVGASWGLSHSETFCDSCHYVEHFVDEWRHSEHADVPCWKCHNHEGFTATVEQQTHNLANGLRYLLGVYDYVPRAEVQDAACLRDGCHLNRKLEGKVPWKNDIVFDHAGHLDEAARGIRLPCVSCHSRIVQGEHMTVTEESCYLCHFKDMPKGVAVAGCRCHGTPEANVDHKGFTVDHEQYLSMGMLCADCHLDVTRGDGEVPQDRCNQCHLWRDVKDYDRNGIHDNHVTVHDIACNRCHEPVEHEQVEMVRTLEVSCAGCHRQTHSPHLSLYMGIGAEGVDPLPDVMFQAQVGCDGCHRDQRQGPASEDERIAYPTRKACKDCHGEGYDQMLDGWKSLLSTATGNMRTKRDAVTATLATVTATDATKAATDLVKRAERNLSFLARGHGEHNILYAERILVAVQKDLDDAAHILDPQKLLKDVLDFDKATITTNCTENCHRDMARTLLVKHDGLELSHRDHIEKHHLQCAFCHDNGKVHGSVRLQKQQCVHCHHTQQSAECGVACHKRQRSFLYGEGGFDVAAAPDPMAGEVACDECHQDLESGHDRDVIMEACVECHEDSYGTMADKWQADLGKRLELLSEKVKAMEASATGRSELKDLIKAKGNLDLIRGDRSGGAHNPGFAGKLLDAAEKELDGLGKEAPVSGGL